MISQLVSPCAQKRKENGLQSALATTHTDHILFLSKKNSIGLRKGGREELLLYVHEFQTIAGQRKSRGMMPL